MINSTAPYFDQEIEAALGQNDEGAIDAAVTLYNPHIALQHAVFVKLLQYHAVLDLTGQQNSPQHEQCIAYLERVQGQLEHSLTGMWN